MSALERLRDAASTAGVAAARGVRDAASSAGEVARAVVHDQVTPLLAGAGPADAADPRGPRPWPVLVAEPYCLVRLPARADDALGALSAAMAGEGLVVLPHSDGWGLTTARTERAVRAGVWQLDLSFPVPGTDGLLAVSPSPNLERLFARALRDDTPGWCTLRLEVERDPERTIGGGL